MCYNCDEKIVPGHRCKKQMIYLLQLDSNVDEPEELPEVIDEEELDYAEEVSSSVKALNGNVIHTTLKVKGFVKKKPLTILIDSGSTHSFLDPRAADLLGCELKPTLKLMVTVADGGKVISDAKYSAFKWSI